MLRTQFSNKDGLAFRAESWHTFEGVSQQVWVWAGDEDEEEEEEAEEEAEAEAEAEDKGGGGGGAPQKNTTAHEVNRGGHDDTHCCQERNPKKTKKSLAEKCLKNVAENVPKGGVLDSALLQLVVHVGTER